MSARIEKNPIWPAQTLRGLSMNRSILLTAMVTSLGFACLASTPLATISSPQGFDIDGHHISVPGVSSWPLVIGDQVTTSSAPGTILFQDGSTIKLGAQSCARLAGTITHPKLVLMAGNLDYKLSSGSKLELGSPGMPGTDGPAATGPAATGPAAAGQAPGSAAGTGTSAGAAGTAGVSTAAVVTGTLVAAGMIAVLPVHNAVATPASSYLPPISTP